MNRCTFSPCRRYRYTLEHVANDLVAVPRLVLWIMLNPSTADERQLDPTLRRCRGFSLKWGFDGFMVGNLYAYRSTDPAALWDVSDPVGPENLKHLLDLAERAELIVCGWGQPGPVRDWARDVTALLRQHVRKPLHHMRLNKDGSPGHPLYLAGSLPPVAWEVA